MELTGKIIVVQEPKSGTSSKTGNPWMMQEYVIEVPGHFSSMNPQYIRWFPIRVVLQVLRDARYGET